MNTVAMVILAAIVCVFLLTVLFGAPFVPSKKSELNDALSGELYKLKEDDLLVDIGSGSGTVLSVALNHGARCLGYEINPLLWLVSKVRFFGQAKTNIVCRNFFTQKHQFPKDTTVVYIFGIERVMPGILSALEKFSRQNNKAVYLISYGFELSRKKPEKKYGAFWLYKISPDKNSALLK